MQITQNLEQFLLGNWKSLSYEMLYGLHLAAFAYTQLASSHTLKEKLKPAFVMASVRHQMIKREVLQLCGSCHDADVDILLFKGFYLAETVYHRPAQRFYGDVDVIIKPEQQDAFLRVLNNCGWHYELSNTGSHMLACAYSPQGYIRLDIHLDMSKAINVNPFVATSRLINAAVWQRVDLQDEGFYVMHPVDSFLVGLVINRCWSDHWILKPHDYLDAMMLIAKYGFSRDELETRAKKLRCFKTLQLFLARCNPWIQTLDLSIPTKKQRLSWNISVASERRFAGFERYLIRSPQIIPDVFFVLPRIIFIYLVSLKTIDVETLFRSLDKHPFKHVGRSIPQLKRGIRWSTWLLFRNLKKRSLIRALSCYSYLKEIEDLQFCQGSKAQQQYFWLVNNKRPLTGFEDESYVSSFEDIHIYS